MFVVGSGVVSDVVIGLIANCVVGGSGGEIDLGRRDVVVVRKGLVCNAIAFVVMTKAVRSFRSHNEIFDDHVRRWNEHDTNVKSVDRYVGKKREKKDQKSVGKAEGQGTITFFL